jgi:flagellar protein FlgJ
MNVSLDTGMLPWSSESDKETLKRTGAAKDFEALLIGQMLKSMRDESSGWLGTGEDESSDSAIGLGEEQLAKALSAGGGFGLAKAIQSNIR